MRKIHYLTMSLLAITIAGTLFYVLLSPITTQAVLNVKCDPATNIVDKRQGEAFTVKVAFKNTGDTTGTWKVNVSFESESNWSWQGTPQALTLKPDKTASITWTGSVSENASVGSTARLIVYFDDKFVAQNWWIHVLPGAELKIVSSEVD